MSTTDLSKALYLIFFLCLPVAAQTSSELHRQYQLTPIVESFEVRPEVIATVFYGEDGQAVEVLIRPRLFYANDASGKEMPYKVFEELLDEFAPAARRGKLCKEIDTVSGRNHYVHQTYENVSIYSVIHNKGADNATASTVQIRWERIYCPMAAQ